MASSLSGFLLRFVARHQQPLDDFAFEDVAFHDLGHVGFRPDPVPHAFGINDDARPILAVIQTTGLVGPHRLLESEPFNLLLEESLKPLGAIVRTAATRVAFGALVDADKDVMFKDRHRSDRSRISRPPRRVRFGTGYGRAGHGLQRDQADEARRPGRGGAPRPRGDGGAPVAIARVSPVQTRGRRSICRTPSEYPGRRAGDSSASSRIRSTTWDSDRKTARDDRKLARKNPCRGTISGAAPPAIRRHHTSPRRIPQPRPKP